MKDHKLIKTDVLRRFLKTVYKDCECDICCHQLDRGCMFLPCGHTVCTMCRHRIDKCPQCRSDIMDDVQFINNVNGLRFRTWQ